MITVEGLSNDADLTPLQKSFRKHHALQCGFCTPGMITTAHALLSEEPDCDAARVREVLSGNLCRCTGYISIVEAVLDARAAYRREDRAGGRRATVQPTARGSAHENGQLAHRQPDRAPGGSPLPARARAIRRRRRARTDMLHAAILRSSVAHGRIRSIDVAAARALPGVHA